MFIKLLTHLMNEKIKVLVTKPELPDFREPAAFLKITIAIFEKLFTIVKPSPGTGEKNLSNSFYSIFGKSLTRLVIFGYLY